MRLRTWKQPMGYGETVKKLCEKIERDCGIKCDPHTFRRTYAGSQMKCYLSYVSWTMKAYTHNGDLLLEVGSMDPASELIKKKYKLDCYWEQGLFGNISGREE